MQIDLTYLRKLVMLLSKWGLRGLLHENSQKIDKMCLFVLIFDFDEVTENDVVDYAW